MTTDDTDHAPEGRGLTEERIGHLRGCQDWVTRDLVASAVTLLTQGQRSWLIQRLRNALTFGDDPLVRLLRRYPPAGAAPSPTAAAPRLGEEE